jgi:outer membrane protein OmpA-like peptidoglycan-associated protein
MRKFFMSLVIAGIAISSYSQEIVVEEVIVPVKRYCVETNRFWDNWFVNVNGGINLYNGVVTNGESPFRHISPNLSAYIGKWHTPGFGWRAGYTGLNMKPWKNSEHVALAVFHFDAMFDVLNMCCGYRENRIYNMIPYAGFGWGGREAYSYEDFSGLSGTLAISYGIINTFRITERFAINLELSGLAFRNGFSGKTGKSGSDMMWSASVGVTFRLGKPNWNHAVDVDALQAAYSGVIAGLGSELNDANIRNRNAHVEIENLEQKLAASNKKCSELEKKTHTLDVMQSVFFPFGSAELDSKKEELNIKAYAQAAKAAGVKLRVVGFADVTGPEDYNKILSTQRAETVADMLKANGAEVVSVVGVGASSEYSTKYLNRRALIEVAK